MTMSSTSTNRDDDNQAASNSALLHNTSLGDSGRSNFDPILNPFIRKTINQLRCLEKQANQWQLSNLSAGLPWNMIPSSVTLPANFEQFCYRHQHTLEPREPHHACSDPSSKHLGFGPDLNLKPEENFPSTSDCQYPLATKSVLKCVLCPYITHNMLILMDHIDTHFPVKTFVCIHCYKSFAGNLDLSMHPCPFAPMPPQ